jgi:hypothetical protein
MALRLTAHRGGAPGAGACSPALRALQGVVSPPQPQTFAPASVKAAVTASYVSTSMSIALQSSVVPLIETAPPYEAIPARALPSTRLRPTVAPELVPK